MKDDISRDSIKFHDVLVTEKSTRNEDVDLLQKEEELLNLLTLGLSGLAADLLQTATIELRLAPLAKK